MIKRRIYKGRRMLIRILFAILSALFFVLFKYMIINPQFGRGYIFLVCLLFLGGLIFFILTFRIREK
jgi:Na+/melibiose symporter-like transporter